MTPSLLPEPISRAAEALFEARRTGTPIEPLRETFGLTPTDAAVGYAIQEVNTERYLAAGRRPSGRKIGLTSRAVQAQLGVGEPDFGMLWADTAYRPGEPIPRAGLISPKVEAELAFVVDRALPDPATSEEMLRAAIAYCVPAVELVDSAIREWRIALVDTIADNASAAGYILGADRKALEAVDLRLFGMVMSRGSEDVSLGVGAACLGNPLHAALWLVRTMARLGRPLAEGDVILSGALGPMVAVRARDRFRVELQGFSPFDVVFD